VNELLTNAEFWVGFALVIFIGLLVWLKVPRMAAQGLDAQADAIRRELAEAERLRTEAEQLLASIRSDREEAERTARQMLTNAEAEAKRIESEAHARLEEQIARQGELAKRKIALAEAQATAEVKAAAAELAADIAGEVLSARLSAAQSDPLVDRAIGDIPTKLS
jgi:F-type H+-transporting ATPase subunit b